MIEIGPKEPVAYAMNGGGPVLPRKPDFLKSGSDSSLSWADSTDENEQMDFDLACAQETVGTAQPPHRELGEIPEIEDDCVELFAQA